MGEPTAGMSILGSGTSGFGSGTAGFGSGTATIESGGTEVHVVSIDALKPARSPRLGGEDADHIRLLSESGDELPPILVHRSSMRVIDGMHRLKAAILQGANTIRVQFFEGTEMECFLASVRANISHGLPLSLADRQAAAARILASYEDWSDRAIAAATGLAPKTVGAIRRREVGNSGRAAMRVGRDGKVRPVSANAGRRLASEMMGRRPDMSLRQVATAAGISRATARDVRRRMQRGENPLVGPEHTMAAPERANVEPETAEDRESAVDRKAILENLARDPALRFSEPGRALLRWLASQSLGLRNWTGFVDTVPPHCSYLLMDLARECATDWLTFAEELERRIRQMAQ